MDLHEDAEKNLVTATFEFPGVKKEDVQVDVPAQIRSTTSSIYRSMMHTQTAVFEARPSCDVI